jgi:ATP-dependent DNA helicase RecG
MSDPTANRSASGLDKEIQFVKGVGPAAAKSLKKLGIATVRDALYYFPWRYEDRRHLPPIASVQPGQEATVRGRLTSLSSKPVGRGRCVIVATIEDDSGQMQLTWFNQPWMRTKLAKVEGDVIAYGRVKESHFTMEMPSPEWEEIDSDESADAFARIVPIYKLSEGVFQATVRRACRAALAHVDLIEDPVPTAILEKYGFRPLQWAVRHAHQPEALHDSVEARSRLVFDEFLGLQLALQMRRLAVQQEVGIAFPISALGTADYQPGGLFDEPPAKVPLWDEVHRLLPFKLTGAQKRVIDEIWADMARPAPMNRLLQGDVGSGKTAVAASAILAAVRCGYQAALMAPTEILAEQHYMNLRKLFEPVGIDVGLLVGKHTAKQRREAREKAALGQAKLSIGTHALIQEGVEFKRLGLAIVDEQHRFGVLQRAALRQKGLGNPDVLVMTATPIPRTMTMTLYGDLDLSLIDELPPGRRPIKTHWKKPYERPQVYTAVSELLEQGRQAYFVCPLINESEKMQMAAAVDLHYRLSHEHFADFRVGLLHGDMKPVEKEEVMAKFRAGDLDILVSTVVIEVGVDVPNATVMVIEDAHRFGLSQLHQLRGRVGRGSHQSFCVLIGAPETEEAEQRLGVLVQTNDGFKIAEEDLNIRGPGELAGTKQSGMPEFKVADLLKDGRTLEIARSAAVAILKADPGLEKSPVLLSMARAVWKDDALISVS